MTTEVTLRNCSALAMKPEGPALALLHVVRRNGVEALIAPLTVQSLSLCYSSPPYCSAPPCPKLAFTAHPGALRARKRKLGKGMRLLCVRGAGA